MQAQAPNAPYVGLWTRLAGFRAEQLSKLVTGRRAVRGTLMRATLHLTMARDALFLRPLVQSGVARCYASSPFARNLVGVDVDVLLEVARALLNERPRTRTELSAVLSRRWPGVEPTALVYTVTYLLPTVQVPPRGIWGATGAPTYTTLESWTGKPVEAAPSLEKLVLRYLAAFGPASVSDAQTWSGLTRLGAVAKRLRPRLRVFRNERGVELFDLPDAPRPDEATPAPPRFLPEYDNLTLSYADRARVLRDERRPPLFPGSGGAMGSVLVDGFYSATWRIKRERSRAILSIASLRNLAVGERRAVAAEGEALLGFAAAGATTYDIRFSRS
jgi:hypothetical protein